MPKLSIEAVIWGYRLLLDREPEDEHAIEAKVDSLSTTQELRLSLLNSEEYQLKFEQQRRDSQSPFYHYSATFDAVRLMCRYAADTPRVRPGYLVNFLGVAIDPKFFPALLEGRAGTIEAIPTPANWHADIAEWGAALRAVDLSGETFVAVELGCGWGCWMNNTGVAARSTGRKVRVVGIEGDVDHVQFAREALATNGFAEDEVTLRHGVASHRGGMALFPKQATPGSSWGGEPIFDASDQQRSEAMTSGRFEEVPMVALAELIGDHARVDLLHVDIQGGEATLVGENLPLLKEKVAYMLIGTHSKQIEGRLYEMLLADGWQLEMERAAIFDIVEGQPHVRVDGVQGWRNALLLPLRDVGNGNTDTPPA